MSPKRAVLGTLFLFVLVGTWGCPPPEEPADDPGTDQEPPGTEEPTGTQDPGTAAEAEMMTAEGELAGVVALTPQPQPDEGVTVRGVVEVTGLDAGPKGLHVHEMGECEPPSFESAGDHFDPQGHPHGGPDDPPDQRHAGDFGNVEVGEDGRAEIALTDTIITVGQGENDVAGRSLVLHEGEDDLTTQPDGDAGDRAACGVIERAVAEEDDG